MKVLGRLDNGNLMLECTEQEHQALRILSDAAAGKHLRAIGFDFGERLDAEMSQTLAAVAEWIEIKDRATQLRNLANDIDRAVGGDNA